MFSFSCVKSVVSARISLVKVVYRFIFGFVEVCGLLSFPLFIRGFYYTFTRTFWVVVYSAGAWFLPVFHKLNNKDDFNPNTFIINYGVL